jgi:hypothetical protein
MRPCKNDTLCVGRIRLIFLEAEMRDLLVKRILEVALMVKEVNSVALRLEKAKTEHDLFKIYDELLISQTFAGEIQTFALSQEIELDIEDCFELARSHDEAIESICDHICAHDLYQCGGCLKHYPETSWAENAREHNCSFERYQDSLNQLRKDHKVGA